MPVWTAPFAALFQALCFGRADAPDPRAHARPTRVLHRRVQRRRREGA